MGTPQTLANLQNYAVPKRQKPPATSPADFQGITLDMSTSVPVNQPPVKLDMSTSIPVGQDEASRMRQMLVSGLTGMPTPVMTAEERQQFQQGKVAGAVSVPIVAGATLGATAAAEAVPSVVNTAKTVASWAKANPIKAAALEGIARELGVDPFRLTHKIIKYGKGLFGGDAQTGGNQ
jgi:hypothetical protein